MTDSRHDGAPRDRSILAEVGGGAVAEQGRWWWSSTAAPGRWPPLRSCWGSWPWYSVFGGFGAATLALTATGGTVLPWRLSAIFLLVGLGFAGAALGVVGRIRSARARPLSGYRPVAMFDRARRLFVDADDVVVAPLDQVRFQQPDTAHLEFPDAGRGDTGRSPNLKRGNPFNGGLGNLEAVLTAAVFAVAR